MDIREKVKSLMAQKGIRAVDVTEEIGVSKSVISKFLSGKDMDFKNLLPLLKYLDSYSYLDILDEYCLTLEKPVSIMKALEYASIYRRDELSANLLTMHSKRKGELGDWIIIYSLFHNMKTLDEEEVLFKCRELYGKVSTAEIKIKIDLIEAFVYYKKINYTLMLGLTKRAEQQIDRLSDGFIKECFKIRLSTYLANAQLYANEDIEAAVKYANYVINNKLSPLLNVASAYHTLGHAHTFIDTELSVKYLKDASRMFKMIGYDEFSRQLLTEDMSFVLNVNGIIYDESIVNDEELAHQLIRQNRKEEAIEVLNKIESETPFSLLYRGIATNDFAHILKAHGMMVRAGNTFF